MPLFVVATVIMALALPPCFGQEGGGQTCLRTTYYTLTSLFLKFYMPARI
jgi:hypothetical protein